MDNETLNKYAELIISMSTQYLLGNLDAETYKINLDMISKIVNNQIKS